jgi:hypothetical protein
MPLPRRFRVVPLVRFALYDGTVDADESVDAVDAVDAVEAILEPESARSGSSRRSACESNELLGIVVSER